MESPLHDDTRRAIRGVQAPLHNAIAMLVKSLSRLPLIPADDVPERLLWREQLERARELAERADGGMLGRCTPNSDAHAAGRGERHHPANTGVKTSVPTRPAAPPTGDAP